MSAFQQIEVNKVKDMLDNQTANIVDIRDPASFESGHIPGAVHLTDENVREFTEKGEKDKPLVVYCYHGISSQGAAGYLAEQGFQEVYSMAGGFEAWQFAYPPAP